MSSILKRAAACAALALALAGAAVSPALAGGPRDHTLRFATFNASVNRNAEGELVAALSTGTDPQIRNVAEIIQRARPDVLLVNEFDFVPGEQAARLFQRNYLSVSQHGARPIEFPFRFVEPSNTGIASGKDLDNDGRIVTTPGSGAYGNDAFGFGEFPGKFGLAVFSRLPIDRRHARTFRLFRWKDMPGALLPDDPATPAPHDWYSPDELDVFRLSSKSHWDVPIAVGRHARVHFLVSHPVDGDSTAGAVQQLLENPLINTSVTPTSPGGPEQAALQGGANATHKGDPAFDTADFADTAPGNLRADYVLPDRHTRIARSFVFWPRTSDPLFPLVGTFDPALLPNGNGFPSSDHRLVAVDVQLPGHRHGHPSGLTFRSRSALR